VSRVKVTVLSDASAPSLVRALIPAFAAAVGIPAEDERRLGETFGCELEQVWWTQGCHDMVSVVRAPDEQAMVAYTLAVARLGNLRTTTLRAWTGDEMREIVSRLPS
jgi:uncharacterized protein with GYD domain